MRYRQDPQEAWEFIRQPSCWVEWGMSNIRSLKGAAKKKRKSQAAGNTLCKRGHHKWVLDKGKPFDVRSGKLMSASYCSRCGKRKAELT